MQKKYVQQYNDIMKTYEGQICLFKWHLILLAIIFDSSIVLGMKVEVSVK